MEIKIGKRKIGIDRPTYFIADIAANHDGSLTRAKKLIDLAKKAGADAAKFQHFKAEKIVSDYGFKNLKGKTSHQDSWKKSVFEVYRDYEFNRKWDTQIREYCKKVGIDFFSSPYDFDAVDELEKFVPAYKVGSGDITWDEMLIYVAKKKKPVLLATGASTLDEVKHALKTTLKYNKQVVLMQCNTNYTADLENFKYISLNVLKSYGELFPDLVLGLSDHTHGHATVLGAVALGARVIEKHFTDDNRRIGPDHAFAMNPKTWREMMDSTRELENALGSSEKKVEDNEKDTVIVQRRCLRAASDLTSGYKLQKHDIEVLRPAPKNAYKPNDIEKIIGKKLKKSLKFGQEFTPEDV